MILEDGRIIFVKGDGGCKFYEYGPAGNVKAIITENGSATYFDYDKMYHIVCRTDALEHTLSYEYDKGYNKIWLWWSSNRA